MLLKNFVRTLPGAEYLSEADAEHIVAAMRVDDYEDGHIFVCQDKLAKELHLLLKGRVKVSYYGSTGRNHTLRTLEPGDLFGLLSLSDGKPAVASCVAEDSVRVASLPFSAYMLLYQPHSDIGCRFQYLLAAQLARDLRYRHAMLRNQLSCLYTGQPRAMAART
jgi:CRP-like cAMP-binding protein